VVSSQSVLCSALLALGGCAGIENKAISDEVLARKAAVALNMPDNEVTISNRMPEGMNTLNFTATTKQGSTHRCYIHSLYFGLSQTGAICAGSAGGACNDLLKAAGKC